MFSSAFRQLVYARDKKMNGFLTVALLLSLAACNSGQQYQAPKPKTLTADDLQKLRWIEGSWRGTCNLCVLCVSVVHYSLQKTNHRDTENTEVAQSRSRVRDFWGKAK